MGKVIQFGYSRWADTCEVAAMLMGPNEVTRRISRLPSEDRKKIIEEMELREYERELDGADGTD